MLWHVISQYAICLTGILLVLRLLSLKLQKVYVIFCFYLVADLSGSFLWFGAKNIGLLRTVDYRLLWLADRVVVWSFTLWAISELLSSILQNYPGVLSLSRNVLRYCWVGAFLISIGFAIWEFETILKGDSNFIRALALAGLVVERSIASVSLLAMLATLAFLLWFPVSLPRNLASFSVGFILYFLLDNALLLMRNNLSSTAAGHASASISFIAAGCFLYWTLALSPEGEVKHSQKRISWNPRQQQELLQQLEGLNQAMLGAVRR